MQFLKGKRRKHTMYPWAVNKLKLERAIKTASDKTEEAIKARYIELGGLLLTEIKKVGRPSNVTKIPSVAPQTEAVINKPKSTNFK